MLRPTIMAQHDTDLMMTERIEIVDIQIQALIHRDIIQTNVDIMQDRGIGIGTRIFATIVTTWISIQKQQVEHEMIAVLRHGIIIVYKVKLTVSSQICLDIFEPTLEYVDV